MTDQDIASGNAARRQSNGSNDEKGSVQTIESQSGIIAPDGGWGWVIVFASFFIQVIGRSPNHDSRSTSKSKHVCYCVVFGIQFTFGMFLGELMKTFGTSRATTSMIASIQMGVTLFVGPIAADLVQKYGCRKIAIAGSIIAATSTIISGAAPNIATLYITAGCFTGYLCYQKC